jgi:hypothetical protein
VLRSTIKLSVISHNFCSEKKFRIIIFIETIAENDTIFEILQKFNTLSHSRGLNPHNYHSAFFECNTGFYYINRCDKSRSFAKFLSEKLKEEKIKNGSTEETFQYKDIKFNLYWPQYSA